MIAGIGLAGVVIGQQMSRGAAQEAHYLQIEESRQLEVRQLLVRLLIDVRAQIENAWVVLPMFAQFEPKDFEEFTATETGRAMGERTRRVEEHVTALSLLVPDGPLRAALARLETAAVREWSDKAVGPVSGNGATKDRRPDVEVTFSHLQECRRMLNDVQQQAALYLAMPSQRPPSLLARVRGRLKG